LINYEADVNCFLIFRSHHLKLIKFNGNNQQKERGIIIALQGGSGGRISASIYLAQCVKSFRRKQAMIPVREESKQT
jgi:hypothetical protein